MNQTEFQSEELKYSSCKDNNLIQPLPQKIFSFELNALDNIGRIRSFRQKRADNWRPVLHQKKTNEQPKFIISMQRKKARAISAINGSNVFHPIPTTGKMIGTKLSKEKWNRYSNYIKPAGETATTTSSLIEKNEEAFRQRQLKQRKNPHMNFSLLYLQESTQGKINKNRKLEVKRPMTSRQRPKTCRQKGSQHPYIEGLSHAMNAKKRGLTPRRGVSAQLGRSSHY